MERDELGRRYWANTHVGSTCPCLLALARPSVRSRLFCSNLRLGPNWASFPGHSVCARSDCQFPRDGAVLILSPRGSTSVPPSTDDGAPAPFGSVADGRTAPGPDPAPACAGEPRPPLSCCSRKRTTRASSMCKRVTTGVPRFDIDDQGVVPPSRKHMAMSSKKVNGPCPGARMHVFLGQRACSLPLTRTQGAARRTALVKKPAMTACIISGTPKFVNADAISTELTHRRNVKALH